ncbi:SDR family oxidoreductase [Falsiroseomonas sp. CW058]|uniref:SDR family oxidoreductase n=1 Tax=Falsiroseomonas sp. CW058 TaxID=3388664 RepID=UPI003D3134BD
MIGASGRTGAELCRALHAAGLPFRPVARDLSRWRACGIPVSGRPGDLTQPEGLARAVAGATAIVNCAHARHTPALLAAAPPAAKLILLGSTRRHSRWRDAHGDGVRAGEAAFLGSDRRGVMLHPTMIYGATGEDNVQRLAALLRHLPVAPLPGGGRALVQPIHQADLTRCILAALAREWDAARALVVAGPAPLPYRDFTAAVARAAGLRPPPVVPLPGALLRALAPLARLLPGLPRIRGDEIRRLLEDKAFDVGPMRRELGVTGMPLERGLALTFGASPLASPPAPPHTAAEHPAEAPTCPSSTELPNSIPR